jgi:hypothetical protein
VDADFLEDSKPANENPNNLNSSNQKVAKVDERAGEEEKAKPFDEEKERAKPFEMMDDDAAEEARRMFGVL